MHKLKVLVVDDKRVIGDFFDFTLGYFGHKITVVHTFEEAIGKIQQQPFDIAFLDIVMPDKDGVELLKKVKEIAPQLPVVMMSGYSIDEKRTMAQQLGAVECLKKPFELEDVRRVIKQATGVDIE